MLTLSIQDFVTTLLLINIVHIGIYYFILLHIRKQKKDLKNVEEKLGHLSNSVHYIQTSIKMHSDAMYNKLTQIEKKL